VLRQRERDREQRVQQAERRARERGHQHPGPQRAARVDGQPAGERTRDHDALDAEVQHAGALAQQNAERAEDERRRDAQHRRPEVDVREDRGKVADHRPSLTR